MKRKTAAYFTVEAAMVLTVVFGVVVLVIYLLIFQYNRCLQEQDMGALALKGCSLPASDNEALMQDLEDYAAEIDKDKYLAWEQDGGKLELSGGYVRVEQTGRLHFPFTGLVMLDGENDWETIVSYENYRVSPITFLRFCRKIKEEI